MKCPNCKREMDLVPDKEFFQCPGNPDWPTDSSNSCYLAISKEDFYSSSQDGCKGWCMKNFEVICKNCKTKNVQTTLEDWEGYSEWTVLEDSRLEFKCGDCGKFGSSDRYKKPNEFENFIVQCYCSAEDEYTLLDTLDDDVKEVQIKCDKCGRTSVED